jgi:hypothetical protein
VLAPDYTSGGTTYTVTVTASDGTDSDSESFSVTISNVNRQPILADGASDPVSVDAGASQSVSLSATDPDGDSLNYSIVQQNSPPSFVTITDNGDGTATLDISPSTDELSGTHFVTIQVADDGTPSLSDQHTLEITVTQQATCAIMIDSGTISYGTVDPASISPEQTLQIRNTGNADGTVSVSGSDWMSGTDSKMSVSTTKYAVSSGSSYDSKSHLDTLSNNIGTVLPDGTFDIFLQLKADLTDSLFSGDLTQNIEVNVTC